MQADLEYKVVDGRKVLKTGTGKTLNLSSSGILFESQEKLPVGVSLRLSIQWPVHLDDRVGLTLCVMGRTVRSCETCTAIEILSHEFRTRALPALAGQPQPLKHLTAASAAVRSAF